VVAQVFSLGRFLGAGLCGAFLRVNSVLTHPFFVVISGMPRSARLDISGMLQHVIVRGIEGRPIFMVNQDRMFFLRRFSSHLQATRTDCLSWSLLTNNFHLLLRPRSTVLVTFFATPSALNPSVCLSGVVIF
jgi:hypothetical protein